MAELMEKNMLEAAEPSEEPANIADLIASAGSDETADSPDDYEN